MSPWLKLMLFCNLILEVFNPGTTKFNRSTTVQAYQMVMMPVPKFMFKVGFALTKIYFSCQPGFG